MVPIDIGQISAFDAKPKEKGLLTFYEEQWSEVKQLQKLRDLQFHIFQDQKSQISKSRYFHSNSLNPIKEQNHELKLGLSYKQNVQKKCIKQRLMKKNDGLNKFTRTKNLPLIQKGEKMQRQKNKRQRKINQNVLEQILTLPKVAKAEKCKSIHIKNYPFEKKQNFNEKSDKLRHKFSNLRLKKDSSFKEFHRQNLSISSLELNKQAFQSGQKQKYNQIPGKNQKNYQSYFNSTKNISNYLFPIYRPETIQFRSFLMKTVSRVMQIAWRKFSADLNCINVEIQRQQKKFFECNSKQNKA